MWKQGDDKAFEVLYRRYAFYLLNKVIGKVKDKDIASDLVQDVMMKVYLNKENITIHTTFKGYLLTALRNRFFNYKRDTLLENGFAEINEETAGSENTTTNDVQLKETVGNIYVAVSRLPEQCRKVFLMSREEDLSNKEIAENLGISVKAVEAHITKALKYLREHVGYHWVWWVIAMGVVGGNLIHSIV